MRSISTCIESYEASRERPPTAGAMSMIPRAATCSRWTEDPSVSRTSFAASREPLLMRLSSRERLLAFPRQSFDHLLVSSASWRQSRAPRSCAPRPPHIWGRTRRRNASSDWCTARSKRDSATCSSNRWTRCTFRVLGEGRRGELRLAHVGLEEQIDRHCVAPAEVEILLQPRDDLARLDLGLQEPLLFRQLAEVLGSLAR